VRLSSHGDRGSSGLASQRRFAVAEGCRNQVVDARVWLGFHFRNSVKEGEELGNNVAAWELRRFFQPARSRASRFRQRSDWGRLR